MCVCVSETDNAMSGSMCVAIVITLDYRGNVVKHKAFAVQKWNRSLSVSAPLRYQQLLHYRTRHEIYARWLT